MATVNLHTKYATQLAEEFQKSSYVGNDVNKNWDFTGHKTVKVTTLDHMELKDYNRKGDRRFGEVNEIGDSVQALTVTQDKAFNGSLDAGYDSEDQKIRHAGKIMQSQVRNVLNPFIDRYTFNKWAINGGLNKGMAKPTKTNIVDAIFEATTEMDNHDVDMENRVLYIGSTLYNLLRLSKEFIEAQSLNGKILEKGVVGAVADCKVKKLPDNMLPANVHFMITHPSSVLQIKKINMTRILDEVMGIDGSVLEGRTIFDAFVLGARANGVYVAGTADLMIAAPDVQISGNKATITSAGNVIYYTTDGSDPRYSDTAMIYAAQVTLEPKQVIKACARKDGKLTSPVTTKQNA